MVSIAIGGNTPFFDMFAPQELKDNFSLGIIIKLGMAFGGLNSE